MKIGKELTKGSNELMVLSVLSKTPMYGYEIIKTIEQSSENVFQMKEGTLYPILHSLESGGYLESYWIEVDGRKRKYYKITNKGLKQFEDNTAEWTAFSTAIQNVLSWQSLPAEPQILLQQLE